MSLADDEELEEHHPMFMNEIIAVCNRWENESDLDRGEICQLLLAISMAYNPIQIEITSELDDLQFDSEIELDDDEEDDSFQ